MSARNTIIRVVVAVLKIRRPDSSAGQTSNRPSSSIIHISFLCRRILITSRREGYDRVATIDRVEMSTSCNSPVLVPNHNRLPSSSRPLPGLNATDKFLTVSGGMRVMICSPFVRSQTRVIYPVVQTYFPHTSMSRVSYLVGISLGACFKIGGLLFAFDASG